MKSLREIPEVDAVLGTNSYDKILDAIQDVLGGDRFQEYADLKGLPKIDAQRVVTTGGHYEYLKLQRAVTSTVPTASFRSCADRTDPFRWRN